MKKYATTTAIIATLVMLTGSGCSQIQTVFRSPGTGAPASTPTATTRSDSSTDAQESARTTAPRARLASYQQPRAVTPNTAPKNQQPSKKSTKTDPKGIRIDNVGTNGASLDDSKDTQVDKEKQVAKARFTVPSPGFRQLGTITAAAAFAATTTGDQSARLASQSSVSVGGVPTGAAGLTAPSSTVGLVTASQSGLINSQLAGQGRASSSNIFNPQVNLASGINGACNVLVRAGFTNTHATCQTQRVRR